MNLELLERIGKAVDVITATLMASCQNEGEAGAVICTVIDTYISILGKTSDDCIRLYHNMYESAKMCHETLGMPELTK